MEGSWRFRRRRATVPCAFRGYARRGWRMDLLPTQGGDVKTPAREPRGMELRGGRKRPEIRRRADQPRPRRAWTGWLRGPMKRRRSGDAATATTTAPRPARAKVTGGHRPTRRETMRDTPFASIKISPSFSRVTKVEDMPARFRS